MSHILREVGAKRENWPFKTRSTLDRVGNQHTRFLTIHSNHVKLTHPQPPTFRSRRPFENQSSMMDPNELHPLPSCMRAHIVKRTSAHATQRDVVGSQVPPGHLFHKFLPRNEAFKKTKNKKNPKTIYHPNHNTGI